MLQHALPTVSGVVSLLSGGYFIIPQVMLEATAAKSRAARHRLPTAWTGPGRLFCAATTATRACDGFNTMTGRADRKGKQAMGDMSWGGG